MKPTKKAVISDLDNTLALLDRDPYKDQDQVMSDRVNAELLRVLHFYQSQEIALIFVTGRWENYDHLTSKWLEDKGLTIERLFSRPLTNYDTGTRLKQWYLENIILSQYIPLLAFDDITTTIKMYRDHDIDAWQINNDSWMSDQVV